MQENFRLLCGSPQSPAVKEEKEGTEELNYLCQSSLSVTGLHLSYYSAFLGLMIRHYLELGIRRKAEVIWLFGKKKCITQLS